MAKKAATVSAYAKRTTKGKDRPRKAKRAVKSGDQGDRKKGVPIKLGRFIF